MVGGSTKDMIQIEIIKTAGEFGVPICGPPRQVTWFFRPVSPIGAPYPPSTGERARRPQVRRAYALAATVVIRALIGIGVPGQSDNCVSELIIELERIFLSEQQGRLIRSPWTLNFVMPYTGLV